MTAYLHLKKLGKVRKLETLVPHTHTEANKAQRLVIITSLSQCQQEPCLKNIVIGVEKWIHYKNVT